MAEASNLRIIRIAAPDDTLIQALAAHRRPVEGWRFMPLDTAPEADALVILDFDDPAEQSRQAAAIREAGFVGPIVMLGADVAATPDDEPIDRPVRLGTLLARIDAHAAEPVGAETYLLGPYDFVPAERTLRGRADGAAIRLTELERKLLACLAEVAGATIGREELLSRVWGYSPAVATHTVETHVWRLRQKMETDDPSTHLLITESGGYRLARLERQD